MIRKKMIPQSRNYHTKILSLEMKKKKKNLNSLKKISNNNTLRISLNFYLGKIKNLSILKLIAFREEFYMN